MSKFSNSIVNQQFRKVYDFLISLKRIRGKSELAEYLDTYNHVINDILKGKRNVTVEQLNKLFSAFDINANYLFGLSEDLFLEGAEIPEVSLPYLREIKKSAKRNIRLIEDVRAFAGDSIDLTDTQAMQNLYRFSIPGLEGDLFAIEIEGDSMTPTITSTDLIVCELLEKDAPLRDNQVYVIMTDTVVAKRIQQIREDNQLVGLRLISDNDKVYKPYSIDLEEIRHILKVKCRVTGYGMG